MLKITKLFCINTYILFQNLTAIEVHFKIDISKLLLLENDKTAETLPLTYLWETEFCPAILGLFLKNKKKQTL